MIVRRLLPLALCFLVAVSGGCESRVLLDYRDTPYLADYDLKDDDFLVRKLKSIYIDDRIIALRVIAERSARAREAGDQVRADLLAQTVLDRYVYDKNAAVKDTVISICAPICGKGSSAVEMFLRERIAEGEWAVPAAFSLASIEPKDAYGLLAPLTEHPSREIRFRAALAMTTIGDPRAHRVVRSVIADMRSGSWPEKVGEYSLGYAVRLLSARADRVWGEFSADVKDDPLRDIDDTSSIKPFGGKR
ncbi:MAG: hypothetical protein JXR97_02125 [Planctomycetes bacterium]|nr:hypothetical protein [Planctomycetota bacterium]